MVQEIPRKNKKWASAQAVPPGERSGLVKDPDVRGNYPGNCQSKYWCPMLLRKRLAPLLAVLSAAILAGAVIVWMPVYNDYVTWQSSITTGSRVSAMIRLCESGYVGRSLVLRDINQRLATGQGKALYDIFTTRQVWIGRPIAIFAALGAANRDEVKRGLPENTPDYFRRLLTVDGQACLLIAIDPVAQTILDIFWDADWPATAPKLE